MYEPAADIPNERAILVGVHLPVAFGNDLGGDADTAELGRLAETAGAEVVSTLEQRRQRPDSRTFIGRGKVEELQELIAAHDANLVVFDNELSPAQGRNLEKALEVKLLDRTELILDIFARHARTRQSRLQVELAQLQYLLPRLTRLWSHLERQAGGIGTRGPGETQLETDRRLVGRRISRLKQDLATIADDRRVQTKGRMGTFRVALVGYTNAGKSTLMNGLTGAGVLVEDQLFATLDAITRKVESNERHRFLVTDTVGFIRRLPHHLVESFQATLQEVREADLLVHVVDAGEDPDRQIASVNKVLAEIAPDPVPTLLVFNKLDTVDGTTFHNYYQRHYPEALFVTGRTDAGVTTLKSAIFEHMMAQEEVVTLQVPSSSAHRLSRFFRTGSVLAQSWNEDHCLMTVRMHADEYRRLLAADPAIRPVDSS